MGFFVVAALLVASSPPSVASAQIFKTINSSEMNAGYMNVFNLPSAGGGYQFGSPWGIADLNATFGVGATFHDITYFTFSPTNVVLSPNTLADPHPFWYTPSGQVGALGNKIMEANLHGQAIGTYAGQTVTFAANTTGLSLATNAAGLPYAVVAFVRDYAPDFSSFSENKYAITNTGAFSVSLPIQNDPARYVWWGLRLSGPNIWPSDTAQLNIAGNAEIEAVSEPADGAVPVFYLGKNTSSNTLQLVEGIHAFSNSFIGFSVGANGNSLTVQNNGTLLTNTDSLTVGYDGSGNRMVVADGATVLNATGRVGVGFAASNNTVLVTGAQSLWSNSSTLTVGGLGTNNSLTVANGGTVAASGVLLGLTNGSSGVLNIGRFGESNAGGTINAQTIALGAAGSRINFNQSNTITLSSSVSGVGSLHQNGTGTTILTGLNTYSGVSAINAGTLQIGDGGTNGTIGSGAITNNGQLVFNLAADLTLSSAISGLGSLYQNGTGTTVLTGLNTYSGVSVINAGTLQIGDGGTTGTIGSGNITNNSRLVINRSDSYIITNNIFGTGELIQMGGSTIVIDGGGGGGGGGGGSGGGSGSTTIGNVIGGTSGLTKTGEGTLIMTADNTYTGTTTIAGGTLQLGNETPTGSTGPGDIVNNATLAIKRSNTFILGNYITGSGQVRQTGSGTTVMTGSNDFTGTTTISSGRLVVNGSAASSSFVVEAAGTLSGHGVIGLISGAGLVDPGNSPGILNAHAVNPSSGLDFRFEFNAFNPNYSSVSASDNDLLRLTAALPFMSPLNAGNAVNIFFNLSGVSDGSIFTGGFFTDKSFDFSSLINGGSYRYYVADNAGATVFDGQAYSLLDESLNVLVSTISQTVDFHDGQVNGQVARFEVVPEPSTYALLLMTGAGALWWARRRRK